ncbi:hypothetical protein CsSME_00037246 [Camellia sinensis var. sinensis]
MPGLSDLHEMGVSGRLIHEAYVTVPSSYLTALDAASWNCMTCLRVESECGFYSNGANPKIGLNPSIFSCNFLLKCLAEANRVEYLASLFKEIKKSGPLPNVRTYTIMMSFYCKGSYWNSRRNGGELGKPNYCNIQHVHSWAL